MAGDRVRDEAERLVAAALAAVSSATRGLGASGPGIATGSAECCVCPVCKAIAAMRDPNSDLADRLAAGVGDLATSVTALLRTLSGWNGGHGNESAEPTSTSEGDEFWEGLRRKAADAARAYGRPPASTSTVDDDPWRAATREPEAAVAPDSPAPPPAPRSSPAAPRVAKKAMAKKAVAKKAVKAASAAEAGPSSSTAAAGPAASDPAGATAGRTVAKKTMAKKAVKKAVPAGGAA